MFCSVFIVIGLALVALGSNRQPSGGDGLMTLRLFFVTIAFSLHSLAPTCCYSAVFASHYFTHLRTRRTRHTPATNRSIFKFGMLFAIQANDWRSGGCA